MTHVTELDGIRALAVMLVFISHAGMGEWVPGGLGVTIFFFLSGYLITSLMRAEANNFGRINIPAFYMRRVLRIIPPMWIVLSFTYIMTTSGIIEKEIDPLAVPSQFLFLINYAHLWGHEQGIPGIPLWSLAVEEHFYVLFPLTYTAFLLHLPPRRAAIWCLVGCIGVLFVRFIHVEVMGEFYRTYYWSHTRIDSILFGCCLALWNNPVIDLETAWKPKFFHLTLAFIAIIGSLLVRSEAFRETIRYTIQGIALFVVFSYVLHKHSWTSNILNNYLAQKIGLYSYSIYLIHVPILLALSQNFPDYSEFARGLVAAAIAFSFSAMLYILVEAPIAKIRRNLRSSNFGAKILR